MYRILLLVLVLGISFWPVSSYAEGSSKIGIVD